MVPCLVRALVLIALVALSLPVPAVCAIDPGHVRFFFLHHSTGRNLLVQGGARDYLTAANATAGTSHVLWDHDYNYIGLADATGELLGYNYLIPGDNTYPAGLHTLWTTANSARDSLLSRYDVVAFKSCYPTCNIVDDAMLEQYKTWYLAIRDELDQHPAITFVIMSPPPLHRLATNETVADRARAFAVWLGSDEYLMGHPNLAFFDFFDHLAQPDDGTETRNTLRYEYELSHVGSDSHPNLLANQAVMPRFMDLLLAQTDPGVAAVVPGSRNARLLVNSPNPFNPATTISFSLTNPSAVSLRVFDIRGHLVRTLLDDVAPAGVHEVLWRGTDTTGREVSSGTYFYVLNADGKFQARKMQLLK